MNCLSVEARQSVDVSINRHLTKCLDGFLRTLKFLQTDRGQELGTSHRVIDAVFFQFTQ